MKQSNSSRQQEMFASFEKWKEDNQNTKRHKRIRHLSDNPFSAGNRNRLKEEQTHQEACFLLITVTSLTTNDSEGSNVPLEIHYPNGVKIILPQGGDLSLVQSYINLG